MKQATNPSIERTAQGLRSRRLLFQTLDAISHMPSPVIIALDFESSAEALALVDRLGPEADHYKVGLQLLTEAGRRQFESWCHQANRSSSISNFMRYRIP